MPGQEHPIPPRGPQPPALGPPALIPAALPFLRLTAPTGASPAATVTVHVDTNLPGSGFLAELAPADNVGRRIRRAGTTDAAGQADVVFTMPADHAVGSPYRLLVRFVRQDGGLILVAESVTLILEEPPTG